MKIYILSTEISDQNDAIQVHSRPSVIRSTIAGKRRQTKL